MPLSAAMIVRDPQISSSRLAATETVPPKTPGAPAPLTLRCRARAFRPTLASATVLGLFFTGILKKGSRHVRASSGPANRRVNGLMTRSDLHRAVDAYYHDEARRVARRGLRPADGRARGLAQPLQYDESGFPIPAATPSFAERLRRLLLG